jgi:hypothetical protein
MKRFRSRAADLVLLAKLRKHLCCRGKSLLSKPDVDRPTRLGASYAVTSKTLITHLKMERDSDNALEMIAAASEPLRVGFYLVPDFPMMTFAAALDPLRQANRIAGRVLYKWIFLSIDGAPVHSSAGLPIPIDHSIADVPACDLVILCAGLNHTKAYKPAVFRWLRALRRPIFDCKGRFAAWAPVCGPLGVARGVSGGVPPQRRVQRNFRCRWPVHHFIRRNGDA